jgi:hypothetical protein
VFEYAKLQEVTKFDSWSWGWMLNNDHENVHFESLWDVLNKLGKDGWQLVCKEKDGEYRQYILMRQVSK